MYVMILLIINHDTSRLVNCRGHAQARCGGAGQNLMVWFHFLFVHKLVTLIL